MSDEKIESVELVVNSCFINRSIPLKFTVSKDDVDLLELVTTDKNLTFKALDANKYEVRVLECQ